MRTTMRFVFLAAAWLFVVALPAAAAPTFPPLTGRVVDDAGILSDDTKVKLTSMLEQQEKQTGVQVVVATLKSLQGYDIDDYGYQLGRAWKIGQKGKDNGVVIEIAPNEHKVRIDVGYGNEGVLTDAQSKLIETEIMVPAFKRGDYNGGVLAGTDAVLKAIGGATIDPNAYTPAGDESFKRHHEHNPIGAGIIPILLLIVLFWIGGWRFLAGLLLGSMLGGGGRGGWGGGGLRWRRVWRWRFRRRRWRWLPAAVAASAGEARRADGERAQEFRHRPNMMPSRLRAQPPKPAPTRGWRSSSCTQAIAICSIPSSGAQRLALVALCAPALGLPRFDLRAATIIVFAVFLFASLVLEWRPLRMAIVPKRVKHAHARTLAHREFAVRILSHPEHDGGVLFFVSLAERYAEIIADHHLHQAAGQAAWDGIVSDFTRHAARGAFADGIVVAAKACGTLLEEHHPKT